MYWRKIVSAVPLRAIMLCQWHMSRLLRQLRPEIVSVKKKYLFLTVCIFVCLYISFFVDFFAPRDRLYFFSEKKVTKNVWKSLLLLDIPSSISVKLVDYLPSRHSCKSIHSRFIQGCGSGSGRILSEHQDLNSV